MTITFNELDHPRALGGTFTDKPQSAPDSTITATNAEWRADASAAALANMAERSPETYRVIDNGFDQSFHGNPDGARVAALARAEGMAGIVTAGGTDGQKDFHYVFLARVDDDGDGHTMDIPFTTGAGNVPTIAEVLDAVLSDSAGLNDVNGVEDWADSLGYDLYEDGPAVRASYQAVLDQDGIVRQFLGSKYDEYLWGEQ